DIRALIERSDAGVGERERICNLHSTVENRIAGIQGQRGKVHVVEARIAGVNRQRMACTIETGAKINVSGRAEAEVIKKQDIAVENEIAAAVHRRGKIDTAAAIPAEDHSASTVNRGAKQNALPGVDDRKSVVEA